MTSNTPFEGVLDGPGFASVLLIFEIHRFECWSDHRLPSAYLSPEPAALIIASGFLTDGDHRTVQSFKRDCKREPLRLSRPQADPMAKNIVQLLQMHDG